MSATAHGKRASLWHSLDETRRHAVRVGAWVFVGFLLLTVGAIVGSRIHTARSGFTIDVSFSFLSNLTRNAKVLLSGGKQIGYVKDIFQKERQTYVRLYLNNSLKGKIPRGGGTQIAIFSNNLFGQKYINIQLGERLAQTPVIQPGEIVRGISPPSFEQMMLSFSSWFEGRSVGEVSELIFSNAALLQRNLDGIINENREDLQAVIKNATGYFSTISTQFTTLKGNLSLIAHNSEEILTAQQQSMTELVQNSSMIAKNLETIEKALSENHGTLGKFSNQNKEIRENVRLMVEYSRSFITCIQERPWVIIYKESCRKK